MKKWICMGRVKDLLGKKIIYYVAYIKNAL